jgi:hypothetical protein
MLNGIWWDAAFPVRHKIKIKSLRTVTFFTLDRDCLAIYGWRIRR